MIRGKLDVGKWDEGIGEMEWLKRGERLWGVCLIRGGIVWLGGRGCGLG